MKKKDRPWRIPKACAECGGIFRPNREHQRFCSNRCRVANWNVVNKSVEVKFRDRIADHERRLSRIEAHLGIKEEES